jgi:hypothetical protein
MSNVLGSSCVMIMGGSSDHVLVGRNSPTGNQSLLSPAVMVVVDSETGVDKLDGEDDSLVVAATFFVVTSRCVESNLTLVVGDDDGEGKI